MKTPLGSDSWQRVAFETAHLRVYDIQLALNEHSSHNLALPFDSVLFMSDGQVFLQTDSEELTLKANQAVWVQHLLPLRLVTIAPHSRFFVVCFNGQTQRKDNRLERFASGTEAKKHLPTGVTLWTASDDSLAKVQWQMLPARYQEPMYYVREATQFILPINSANGLQAHYSEQPVETVTKDGLIIAANQSHSLRNISDRPLTLLSITAPYPRPGRIIKLTR
ncbi:hypothetical protein [Marinomonas ostreistagni]|uniref:hypothetical protein n=1 Tax=Marinomonas ostreistagni TaxID=359209 RepID=UPI00194F3EF4|nr:hypothetical protein [Marinomonas ostreistagni]MBM6550460.1 hypothetical protein [Marinomonas ostreistagni]